MSISFGSGMPASIRVPGTYVEIDASRAMRGLNEWPAKVAILGQRLSAGTVAQATPVRVTSAAQARTMFGRGSNLAHMFEAWFAVNPPTEVWGVALDDNSEGAQATQTITVTGPASAGGVVALLVGGRRVEVAVTSGQANTAIASAINAALNAALDLPVTSGVSSGVVTATARHKGLIGNGIDIRHSPLPTDALPAGVGIAIAAGTAGTLNPVVTTALDALGNTWFTDIVMPWTDTTSIAALETELAGNFGPTVMRDSQGWTCIAGSFSDATTYLAARNSPHVCTMPLRGVPTPTWEWVAALAATCINPLAAEPSRPVQTLQILGVTAPSSINAFSPAEREQLLRTGGGTFTVNDAGQVFVERVVTTYLTNPAGAADTAYLDVETLKTLAFLRFDLRQLMRLRYPRQMLADDGTRIARGKAFVTAGTLRAEVIARALQWEEAGLVEGVDLFKAEILVVRSTTDPNRVDALLPPDLVNQFRVLATQIEFYL